MKYSGYYSVTFKGQSCNELGLLIKKRPDIPAPKRRITEIEVAGRDGVLIQADEMYEPVTISVDFNFMSENKESWLETFRRARSWLRGSGELDMSDDEDFFYKVLYVEISDSERTSRRIGNFKANFICDPYNYSKRGAIFVSPEEVTYNPYMVAHPVYRIEGSGNTSLVINGVPVSVSVTDSITIDTDRMIAFDANNQVANTSLIGDYADLYLREGDNTISIGDGFTLTVQPNWRAL